MCKIAACKKGLSIGIFLLTKKKKPYFFLIFLNNKNDEMSDRKAMKWIS